MLTHLPHASLIHHIHPNHRPQGVSPRQPLTFRGGVYQQLPANGLPYCSSAFANQTVFVQAKNGKSWAK